MGKDFRIVSEDRIINVCFPDRRHQQRLDQGQQAKEGNNGDSDYSEGFPEEKQPLSAPRGYSPPEVTKPEAKQASHARPVGDLGVDQSLFAHKLHGLGRTHDLLTFRRSEVPEPWIEPSGGHIQDHMREQYADPHHR